MREILVTLLITLATLNTTQAQTPNSFPYQAAARSANGRPLANKAITARISLRDSVANGIIVYRETHNLTTNALGLFDLRVGQGTVVSGSFGSINWGGAAKFIQTEIDTGSGNFLDMGTTQLLSVPYALYAKTAANDVPSGGVDGQILTRCNGKLVWTTNGQCPGVTPFRISDIDGNQYDTVIIGAQTWLKQNLRVTKYRNGDPIITGLSKSSWNTTNSGAFCVFNNDPSNSQILGNLYNFYAVVDSRGLCPAGWHVPTSTEWDILSNFLGGVNIAGGALKSTITGVWPGGWLSPNSGATNSSGFSAIATGIQASFVNPTNEYYDGGTFGAYWTSTLNNIGFASLRFLLNDNAQLHVINDTYYSSVRNGSAVRCLKD